MVGFANNEPIKLKAMGVAVNQINSWDYFSLVGHGLITGAGKVKNAPAEVGKMVRASYKGLQYALAHPEETFAILSEVPPGTWRRAKKQEWEVLKASMALWRMTIRAHGLGRSDLASWEDAQQLMIDLGMIPQATPVSEIVNLSFLPE